MQPQPVLHLKNVSKNYGKFLAVDDVDVEIQSGEFLTLLGPSGSGKTTLLMMIAGFEGISRGDILMENQSIADVPAEKRNFGMVFQGYALFPHMTVSQNIAYPLDVRNTPKDKTQQRVTQMLELVQLQPFADRFPAELSGGQQQRVALARALSFSPKILLLDEPLGALDKNLRVEVQSQLKEIHNSLGTTFIYVTHDQDEALSMSDRVVIMRAGGIVQIGTPQELYEKPTSEFTAGFLGKSNFLHIEGTAFALRPEKIDISASANDNANTSGVVKSITYFGSIVSVVVNTERHGCLEVAADAWRNHSSFIQGQTVHLSWREDAAVRLG